MLFSILFNFLSISIFFLFQVTKSWLVIFCQDIFLLYDVYYQHFCVPFLISPLSKCVLSNILIGLRRLKWANVNTQCVLTEDVDWIPLNDTVSHTGTHPYKYNIFTGNSQCCHLWMTSSSGKAVLWERWAMNERFQETDERLYFLGRRLTSPQL